MGGWEEKKILKLTSAKVEVEVEAELGNIFDRGCWTADDWFMGFNFDLIITKQMADIFAKLGTFDLSLVTFDTKALRKQKF